MLSPAVVISIKRKMFPGGIALEIPNMSPFVHCHLEKAHGAPSSALHFKGKEIWKAPQSVSFQRGFRRVLPAQRTARARMARPELCREAEFTCTTTFAVRSLGLPPTPWIALPAACTTAWTRWSGILVRFSRYQP